MRFPSKLLGWFPTDKLDLQLFADLQNVSRKKNFNKMLNDLRFSAGGRL